MTRIGKDNSGVIMYLSDEQLKELSITSTVTQK